MVACSALEACLVSLATNVTMGAYSVLKACLGLGICLVMATNESSGTSLRMEAFLVLEAWPVLGAS